MGGVSETNIDEGAKYGIGVRVEGGGIWIIGTYKTKKELKTAYELWKKYAEDKDLDPILPIGLVGKFKDKQGKGRVLKDLL